MMPKLISKIVSLRLSASAVGYQSSREAQLSSALLNGNSETKKISEKLREELNLFYRRILGTFTAQSSICNLQTLNS